MAKYGSFKYGTQKYGAFVNAGEASISPSGDLSTLKLFLRIVGNGALAITGKASKAVSKTINRTVVIFGHSSKRLYSFVGAGIVSPIGKAIKTLYVSINKIVKNITGQVSKSIIKKAGSGAISITGILHSLKYYFLVTIDQILQPLGLYVLRDSRHELLPSTRDNTEEVPGKHGEYDFGTEFKARSLELHVATPDGLTPLQKEQNRALYAKHLNPIKGNKTLIFEDDPTKKYEVKYSGKIDPTRYADWFEFVIPFKMSDPLINSVDEKTLVGSGIILNEGTIETGLIIEISGPATNPNVKIGSDTLSYNGTIASGQVLTIDIEKQTAKIGYVNAMAGYNGIFPVLQPGSVNVTADNNVTIRWHDRWL